MIVGDIVELSTRRKYADNEDLQITVDIDRYLSLKECCQKTINCIVDDYIFADAEYNLIGLWKKLKGFSADDAKYAASCGYEGCWFMEGYAE